jgi:RHS repeat-associated protein
MVDPTGTTTWSYDDAGRVTSIAAPAGTVGYRYDLAGQRTAITQPEGTVGYEYDELGFIDEVTDWTGAATMVDTDPDGRLTALRRPNGVDTTNAYDAAGRLTRVAHVEGATTVAAYDYVLDPNGNRTRATITAGGASRVERYTYDNVDRLVNVDYGDGVREAFGYDPAGNRTSRTVTGGPVPGTTSYAYDAAQQLTSFTDGGGTHTLGHDAAGNVVDDGRGTAFGWDAVNRLVSADTGAAVENYTYDGDDVRVAVDGAGQVWDRLTGVPRLLSDDTAGYVHVGEQALAEVRPAGTSWPLADALGSVRTSVDDAGAVTATAAYDAFGAVRAATGPASTFGFTGEQRDASGLTYLRARSYDPTLGRFLSPDTRQPNAPGTQGWNLYGYANANPTTFIDPTGHGAMVEYASLLRNSVIAQVAIRLVGLCIKGILEGIAMGLALAEILGWDYTLEWEWVLVDCAVEIIFAGFGPHGPPRPRPPRPDPPSPRPPRPRPHGPDAPPGGRPHGPHGPDGPGGPGRPPHGPDGPPRPRDPDAPQRPRDPNTPCHSFTAGTAVLLADGSTAPIDSIEPGDRVWATDPVTGESGPRLVTDVLVHVEDDALVVITADGATITATDHHPFWDPEDKEWVAADDLAAGDRLATADGDVVDVEATARTVPAATSVFNLVVEGVHTFFVVPGDEPVLVHNAGGPGCPHGSPTVNRAGEPYPNVTDPRTGQPIPPPPNNLTKVAPADRVPWTNAERGEYIKEWYDRGYQTPPGGWQDYDIHHITPREYGGTNAFDNLVPVPRPVHQQQFNPWWRNY